MKGRTPSEKLLHDNHLPRDTDEYLEEMTRSIDTNEIFEIVQVFQHQQDHQGGARGAGGGDEGHGSFGGTNDYVVVVLKINSPELRYFFGNGKYLIQIWRNKKRLF